MAHERSPASGAVQPDVGPADASEVTLRTVFEAAPQAILMIDAKGTILQANRSAESMFSYTRAEMTGQPVQMLLPDPGYGANPDPRIHYFLSGDFSQPDRSGDFAGKRKNGAEFPVAVELRHTAWGGSPIVIAFISDSTQRKRLESRLIDVQRIEVAGHLVGGIVHDFNNLLTIVNGHNQLLLDHLPPFDPLRENAREILKAVERASSLVKELLSFNRRQCAPTQKATPLNGAIYDLVGMMRRLLPPDMTLTFRLSPRAGFVSMERGRIDQVLVNLVLNARDALRGRGGTIHISTRRAALNPEESHAQAGQYSVITVRDNGCGMDAAAKQRLFEPFFTTKAGGTGLGLATVQRIVNQGGGIIRVKSTLHHGSTFTICLPRVEGAPEAVAVSAAATPAGTETILLVEDEEGIRRLITTILRKRGYQVLEASNGKEAEEIAGRPEAHIQLLLTDVNLPDAGGGPLAETLRGRVPGLKVLYISGHSEEQAIRRGLLSPGARFLPKPFTVDELVNRVRRVLDEA
ncbi:ATP-binding protein [uncultured Paludibaculum sp.]|uniref:hybrid sensor histidine kinase/response regulator n=1 Tax=uncultured Paludibaculum sp. TaxID=1765020 RepID=UPI002AABC0E7|nr:ATP-binding protein [uncultured Paludibaculum sp.]